MTGAQIFIETLRREGVDTIFGYPGGAVLYIYDELLNSDIRHILVRHEQGAVHMAEGYAKASGKVGVALVTSGPGATNTVTGIADAYMDSVPIVVFTGQVPLPLIGNDAFQEADIVGITRPCTKHNYLVKDINDLARIIRQAFFIAKTGRPGPVLVDIPKDITIQKTEYTYPEEVRLRSYNPTVEGHMGQIKRGLRAILQSRRPIFYVGGGTVYSSAEEEVRALAEKLKVPVALTLMGLGSFPAHHPQFLGMLGMHGTYTANTTMQNADLIFAIGSRFDDRVTGRLKDFAPHASFVHVDIDPSSIGKNVITDVPIVGDIRSVLRSLWRLVEEMPKSEVAAFHKQIQPWWDQIHTWNQQHPLKYEDSEEGIKAQYVVERIYDVADENLLVTTDVGQHQMWAAQYFRSKQKKSFITSGGLGTMGFGFPAAIGAKVARPDVPVFCISGDGSFLMNMQEIGTAVQYNVPVKVAILNNFYLGMVRQWQELFYQRRYSEVVMKAMPDFSKLAEAFGAKGFTIKKKKDVVPVLKEAMKIDGPVIMDFHVLREENVYPMIPAGASLSEIVVGPPEK
ncbi:MAG: biosynthetic-type acetolactate synthase large subunit [Deltaproteobacteria bacterium]|nr:biosynthetic-type acetolactate synthase large subunit [Deltaproteobacteria bacterium]